MTRGPKLCFFPKNKRIELCTPALKYTKRNDWILNLIFDLVSDIGCIVHFKLSCPKLIKVSYEPCLSNFMNCLIEELFMTFVLYKIALLYGTWEKTLSCFAQLKKMMQCFWYGPSTFWSPCVTRKQLISIYFDCNCYLSY